MGAAAVGATVTLALTLATALALPTAVVAAPFNGTWFAGDGVGDAAQWLAALETARSQLAPNPLLQDVTQLYTPTWNGFVEGPTWGAWWTQNSYGTTFTLLPFAPEPLRSFIKNANWLWFEWIGNGQRVGLDDPHPAPDGCLCDAATPGGAYYKLVRGGGGTRVWYAYTHCAIAIDIAANGLHAPLRRATATCRFTTGRWRRRCPA